MSEKEYDDVEIPWYLKVAFWVGYGFLIKAIAKNQFSYPYYKHPKK